MFVYGAYDELVLCGTCPQWTPCPCPQWTVDTVDTVFSLVVRVTFPTLAASLPPASARPAALATAALPLMLGHWIYPANTEVCACNSIDKSLLTSS